MKKLYLIFGTSVLMRPAMLFYKQKDESFLVQLVLVIITVMQNILNDMSLLLPYRNNKR